MCFKTWFLSVYCLLSVSRKSLQLKMPWSLPQASLSKAQSKQMDRGQKGNGEDGETMAVQSGVYLLRWAFSQFSPDNLG